MSDVPLSFGDGVVLSLKHEKGELRLQSVGGTTVGNYVEPGTLVEASEVWTFQPRRTHDAARRYHEEERRLRADGKSLSPSSDVVREYKAEVAENERLNLIWAEQRGYLAYGMVIQLQLRGAGMYLCARKSGSDTSVVDNEIEYPTYLSPGEYAAYWRIMPASRARSEGDHVQDGDQIQLLNMSTQLILDVYQRKLMPFDRRNNIQVIPAREHVAWTARRFGKFPLVPRGVSREPSFTQGSFDYPVQIGDLMQISHRQTDGHISLSIAPGIRTYRSVEAPAKSDKLNDLAWSVLHNRANHSNSRFQFPWLRAVLPSQMMRPDHIRTSEFWYLERPDGTGGPLQWYDQVVFRHVNSGQHLALSDEDIDALTRLGLVNGDQNLFQSGAGMFQSMTAETAESVKQTRFARGIAMAVAAATGAVSHARDVITSQATSPLITKTSEEARHAATAAALQAVGETERPEEDPDVEMRFRRDAFSIWEIVPTDKSMSSSQVVKYGDTFVIRHLQTGYYLHLSLAITSDRPPTLSPLLFPSSDEEMKFDIKMQETMSVSDIWGFRRVTGVHANRGMHLAYLVRMLHSRCLGDLKNNRPAIAFTLNRLLNGPLAMTVPDSASVTLRRRSVTPEFRWVQMQCADLGLTELLAQLLQRCISEKGAGSIADTALNVLDRLALSNHGISYWVFECAMEPVLAHLTSGNLKALHVIEAVFTSSRPICELIRRKDIEQLIGLAIKDAGMISQVLELLRQICIFDGVPIPRNQSLIGGLVLKEANKLLVTCAASTRRAAAIQPRNKEKPVDLAAFAATAAKPGGKALADALIESMELLASVAQGRNYLHQEKIRKLYPLSAILATMQDKVPVGIKTACSKVLVHAHVLSVAHRPFTVTYVKFWREEDERLAADAARLASSAAAEANDKAAASEKRGSKRTSSKRDSKMSRGSRGSTGKRLKAGDGFTSGTLTMLAEATLKEISRVCVGLGASPPKINDDDLVLLSSLLHVAGALVSVDEFHVFGSSKLASFLQDLDRVLRLTSENLTGVSAEARAAVKEAKITAASIMQSLRSKALDIQLDGLWAVFRTSRQQNPRLLTSVENLAPPIHGTALQHAMTLEPEHRPEIPIEENFDASKVMTVFDSPRLKKIQAAIKEDTIKAMMHDSDKELAYFGFTLLTQQKLWYSSLDNGLQQLVMCANSELLRTYIELRDLVNRVNDMVQSDVVSNVEQLTSVLTETVFVMCRISEAKRKKKKNDPLKVPGPPPGVVQSICRVVGLDTAVQPIVKYTFTRETQSPELKKLFTVAFHTLMLFAMNNAENMRRFDADLPQLAAKVGMGVGVAGLVVQLLKNPRVVDSLSESQLIYFMTLVERIKKQKDTYLVLLSRMCGNGMMVFKKTQNKILNYLRIKQSIMVPRPGLWAVLKKSQRERLCKPQSSEEEMMLAYHIEFINLLADICRGRNLDAQFACRSWIDLASALDVLEFSSSPPRLRAAYWRFITGVYIDAQLDLLAPHVCAQFPRAMQLMRKDVLYFSSVLDNPDVSMSVGKLLLLQDALLPVISSFLAHPDVLPDEDDTSDFQVMLRENIDGVSSLVVTSSKLIHQVFKSANGADVSAMRSNTDLRGRTISTVVAMYGNRTWLHLSDQRVAAIKELLTVFNVDESGDPLPAQPATPRGETLPEHERVMLSYRWFRQSVRASPVIRGKIDAQESSLSEFLSRERTAEALRPLVRQLSLQPRGRVRVFTDFTFVTLLLRLLGRLVDPDASTSPEGRAALLSTLAEMGVMRSLVRLLRAPSRELVLGAVRVLRFMVHEVHPDVQNAMLAYISENSKDELVEWKVLEFIEDSLTRAMEFQARASSIVSPSEDDRAAIEASHQIAKALLVIITRLSARFNTLSEEIFTASDPNILHLLNEFLEVVVPSDGSMPTGRALTYTKQIVSALSRLVSGPSRSVQRAMLQSSLLDSVSLLLGMDNPSDQVLVTDSRGAKVAWWRVTRVGHASSSVIDQIATSLQDPEARQQRLMFKRLMRLILGLRELERDGAFSSMINNKGVRASLASKLNLGFTRPIEELRRAGKYRFLVQDMTEVATLMYIVLRYISMDPTLDPALAEMSDVHLPAGDLAYSRYVGRIELIRDDQLVTELFQRNHLASRYLRRQDVASLVLDVDRSTPNDKLEDFLERSRWFYLGFMNREVINANHAKQVITNPQLNRYAQLGFWMLVVLINLCLIIGTELARTDPDSERLISEALFNNLITFLLGPLLILALVVLNASYLMFEAWLQVKKRYEELGGSPDDRDLRSIWLRVRAFFRPGVAYRVISILMAVLGLLVAPYFFAFHIFSIMAANPQFKTVQQSVTKNGRALLLTTGLGVVVIYFYAIFGFLFFADSFGETDCDDPPCQALCSNVINCWVTIVAQLPSGGDFFRDAFTNALAPSNEMLFQISFFIIVVTILLNILFGIIIDTFAELRGERDAIAEAVSQRCFICDLPAQNFDKAGIGFQNHFMNEHSIYDYINYYTYLMVRSPSSLTGTESYVKHMLEAKRIHWLPQGRSVTLEQAEEDQSAGKVDVAAILPSVLSELNQVADRMARVERGLKKTDELLSNVAHAAGAGGRTAR